MGSDDPQEKKLPRQRKSHRKSRQGCGNCKLRSVKCDETKPTCKRCAASGFSCNYSRAAPALQLAHVGAFKLDLSPGLPPPDPCVSIPVMQPVPGRIGDYRMKADDFATLDRFHKRTVLHLGTPGIRQLFSHEAYGLGASHPFLLHVFFALTLIHDTDLVSAAPLTLPANHRSLLAFHWYHATVLLQQKLNQSPSSYTSSERDAIWAASALLGAAAFAHLDSDDPAHAWPLTDPDPLDLDWIKMGDGKKVVWDIVDPLRPDSAFRGMAEVLARNPAPDGAGPIPPGVLPPLFYAVFELLPPPSAESPGSSPESIIALGSNPWTSKPDLSNPYHIPACLMAHLLDHTITPHNMLRFMTFMTQVGPEYKRLLGARDHRALLLMAWWFAKTAPAEAWWLRRRSLVEGLAICEFLRRECVDDAQILELLEFPKRELDAVWKQGPRNGAIRALDM